MIREYWDRITLALAVPITAGFIVMTIFGQVCLDNLPYLTCGGTR